MGEAPVDPTKRFSNRVWYYARYRPGYPAEISSFLESEAGLSPSNVVADIGFGTGLLARLFLDYGNRVYGVEPNGPMREEGKRQLSAYEKFTAVAGRAEATGLPEASVDLIAAGQAFHWFEPSAAQGEFRRILRPGGAVALIWNERKTASSPFLQAYEDILFEFAIDYGNVHHQETDDEDIARFLGPDGFQTAVFENVQELDFEGLKGRLLSSSYAPLPGEIHHAAMLRELRKIFDRFQAAGKVKFEYDTRLYLGGGFRRT